MKEEYRIKELHGSFSVEFKVIYRYRFLFLLTYEKWEKTYWDYGRSYDTKEEAESVVKKLNEIPKYYYY